MAERNWYDRADIARGTAARSNMAKECHMPGETQLHRTLKKEGCRWLYRNGYTAVAAEVRLRPLGIIDAVGAGTFGAHQNHFGSRAVVHQTCFIECKASRSDFLRDQSHDGQMQLCLRDRAYNNIHRSRRPLRQSVGLGKFMACLLQPFANLHYVLAPAGLIKKTDVPPRWGLLSMGPGGISVVMKATWQDCRACHTVESAIARTLSADIFRADDRAMSSVNRELLQQQQALAQKIRDRRPRLLDVAGTLFDLDQAASETAAG
ncbi:MAG: hypothetical protein ACTHLZ_07035 [Tepidisphaeraceae bacterium]